MKLTDLADIPEINKENTHIADKALLLEKINKLISGGHDKLQIVTDFDHTLTRHKMDGKPVLTSFGMFRECPSIPQHYKDEDVRLAAIYKPIEADPVMSVEEKTKHMVEWYVAAHALLKGIKFPKSELKESCERVVGCFRSGVAELVSWAVARRVPLLVFSAGLGEAVVAALRAAQLLQPPCVQVVSNFLALDSEERIAGIRGDVIHTYNKNEAAIKSTDYYELVKDRSNVILMGDNIGDAGMAEGMDHCDVVIKVGFLGHDLKNLPNYLAKFDIVLVEEDSVDLVNAILKLVL